MAKEKVSSRRGQSVSVSSLQQWSAVKVDQLVTLYAVVLQHRPIPCQ